MSHLEPALEIEVVADPGEIINDFCITIGTINGSGSATANIALLRAIFKMGIPVSGKNVFPSNIQGMPTWYTIRVNKAGYLGRVEWADIVVAMNPDTFLKDQERIRPGGALFYPDDIHLPIVRDDIVTYPMPVKTLLGETGAPSKLREYMANMVYVGVLAQMLGIDMDKLSMAMEFHFKGKTSAVTSNFNVILAAEEWAAKNLVKKDPYRLEAMHATEGKIMVDGNTAAALGAIYGGVQLAAWYPITPASGLASALNEFLPVLRQEPDTGKRTCVVVQAEDEIAAMGIAVGAGWAGLRAMVSTSGPGLSLMTEHLGLAYFAEIPVVAWDVQRVGPSTGLPTRTSQNDLTFVNFLGHGDTHFVILLPGTVRECFEYGWKAFDLAERLQTPIIVLSDLDLGMNPWMTEPFEYPDVPMDRGKVLWEEDLEKLLKRTDGQWGRYLDLDGDGIPYRTVLGNRHPKSAYFTRGTGHDEYAAYCEDPEVWERNQQRILRKFETAKKLLPRPVIDRMGGAEIGLISFGSTDAAIQEARAELLEEGISSDHLRVRAIPFTPEVKKFMREYRRIYVIEGNQDGQLRQLLTLYAPGLASRLKKVAHLDGLPLTACWIKDQIMKKEGNSHDGAASHRFT